MKKLKVFIVLSAMMIVGLVGTFAVSAASTDLSSMKIYAVDNAGKKTEVPFGFKSDVYTYDLTVKSDADRIEIDFKTEDSSSRAEIVNERYNLKMDIGVINKTQVRVTATDGATALYSLNTKRLTAQEDANYEYPTIDTTSNPVSKPGNDKNAVTVKVGKKTFKISKQIKGDVPKGFEKATYKYQNKKYECIVKGDASHLVALYLYNDNAEGFYVYNETLDKFYELKNIKIASRMYTIFQPDETAKVLKNYSKDKIQIGDQTVKVWVLDEEEELYLAYAMNWDEEVNLYCYDAREEVFQRYPISEDTFAQKADAEKAYTNLQTNRNNLARKYNMLLKIIGGLIIVIVILVFILINMKLSKKTKKLENESRYDSDSDDETDDSETLENDTENVDDIDLENLDQNIFENATHSDRVYGDEPTFGSEKESREGFYGGEVAGEDEVLIDITADDDTPKGDIDSTEETFSNEEQIEKVSEAAQKEEEDDLRETLKAMLPQEDDDEDDDEDDFVFIDLD